MKTISQWRGDACDQRVQAADRIEFCGTKVIAPPTSTAPTPEANSAPQDCWRRQDGRFERTATPRAT